jgi:hypothetical protein
MATTQDKPLGIPYADREIINGMLVKFCPVGYCDAEIEEPNGSKGLNYARHYEAMHQHGENAATMTPLPACAVPLS